jgi:predicted transcriptional regulator
MLRHMLSALMFVHPPSRGAAAERRLPRTDLALAFAAGWSCANPSQPEMPNIVDCSTFANPSSSLCLAFPSGSGISGSLTIRLDPELDRQLDRLAKRSGRSRSEIARDALRRQLAVLQLDEARKQILPFAEARGYLTDEDVFREIS